MEDARYELQESAQKVADKLPEYIKGKESCVGVKFPRRVIRPLNQLIPRWPYLSRSRARTVACTIQLCDFNRWHLNTWDVGLTCGTMWVWHCTIPVVAVIETLMYEFGVQEKLIREETKLAKIINTFQSKGIINNKLKDDLHELREFRNGIHLYLQDYVDMHDGKPRRYNDAVRALHRLEKALLRYTGS